MADSNDYGRLNELKSTIKQDPDFRREAASLIEKTSKREISVDDLDSLNEDADLELVGDKIFDDEGNIKKNDDIFEPVGHLLYNIDDVDNVFFKQMDDFIKRMRAKDKDPVIEHSGVNPNYLKELGDIREFVRDYSKLENKNAFIEQLQEDFKNDPLFSFAVICPFNTEIGGFDYGDGDAVYYSEKE
jgi:hypothetical protein